MSNRDLLNEFLEYKQNISMCSDQTIRAYRNDLNQFADFLLKNEVSILESSTMDIQDYLSEVGKNKNISTSSMARKLASIKSLYRYLANNKIISKNISRLIKSPKTPKRLPNFLTAKEIKRLLDYPYGDSIKDMRDRLILELFYATGIRISELVRIKINDIDFKDKLIKIKGKGNKERFVIFGDGMLVVLNMPLPGMEEYVLSFPNYYVTGILISLIIGLIFLSYFGVRFAGETKKRSDALNKLQQILAKEYELESLGGQAAAAAHSLGTPLATITVVAKEMRKEVGDNSKFTKDIDLLISQTKRCSEILKKISQKQIIKDEFLSAMSFENLLEEIIKSFKESSEKNIKLNTDKDINKIDIKRNPELVYGLRNFIGNAVKFSNQNILISIISDNINLYILIEDDGPGFPEDIIKALGEPYIKSRSKLSKDNKGLGLGTFLGKTLLERQSAVISFENGSSLNGAIVKIKWRINDISI